jgi:type I restriction enzyme S subunit
MSERKMMTWADLGQLFDGPHATPTRVTEGPYFLNISSLSAGRLDLTQSDHVSPSDFAQWTRRVTPTENDLLFSYETRLGEAALMPAQVKACLGRRMALLRPDERVVDPKFLLYYYLSPDFQQLIEQHTIPGATVNRIGLSTMGTWPVSLPSLPDQQAIAEVLGAVDDKIAANTKVISLVDQVFLAEHTRQSMSEGTTSVSLSSLVGGVIGGDWGTTDQSDVYSEEVRCIRGADIESLQTGGLGKMPTRFIKSNSLKRRNLAAGDIIVEMSGGSPTQSTGRPVLISDALSKRFSLPLMSSNFCRIVRLKNPLTAVYVYGALRKSWNSGEFFQFENGSTGIKNLAFADYCALKTIKIPDYDNLLKFNELANNTIGLMQSIGTESDRLAATRDALLPQLMSGKLRVKEAEMVVSAAV